MLIKAKNRPFSAGYHLKIDEARGKKHNTSATVTLRTVGSSRDAFGHIRPMATEESRLIGLAKRHLEGLKRQDFLVGAAFVGGCWIADGDRNPVLDPATNEEIAHTVCCDVADVDNAVCAAELAFLEWREMLSLDRGRILRKWATLMRRHAEDLAILITCEQGKPLAEARYEVEYAAGFIDWFAAEGERAYGETIPSHKA